MRCFLSEPAQLGFSVSRTQMSTALSAEPGLNRWSAAERVSPHSPGDGAQFAMLILPCVGDAATRNEATSTIRGSTVGYRSQVMRGRSSSTRRRHARHLVEGPAEGVYGSLHPVGAAHAVSPGPMILLPQPPDNSAHTARRPSWSRHESGDGA